ncbi:hypothetical protein [Frigidibacter sp. ROC022]|uniref:hypothetical protein n=1 Tax=Frigidibacter sp. ROC022 TaxID=2971796 RepID=UPI00215A8252|nr:hypothetical protein [Frigidibacter sp. ROC022]MCR8725253.1 hypothetical protein [Frigidibacter sp. ROC022]
MNILDYLLRTVMRQLVNRGVKAGIDRAAGGRKARDGAARDMTPEERRQAKEARQTARRARQAAKLSRRMMR